MARQRQGKGLEPLSDEDFAASVRALRQDARDWVDKDLAPKRERAWRYYNGEVDRSAPTGRSRAVLTEVRDAVESVLVSLMRIFLSADRPAEFQPRGPDDVELAKQQTDASHDVFFLGNDGFRNLTDAFRDGLVAKTGFLKVWRDHTVKVIEERYESVTPDELFSLQTEEGVEVLDFEDAGQAPSAEPDAAPQVVYDVHIRRTNSKGKVSVQAPPPEEMIWNKTATCIEDAIIFGQDGNRRTQDVVAEGLATWAEIEEAGTVSVDSDDTNEREARSGIVAMENEDAVDIADREVRVSELYIRLDKDGDGIPELRRVIMLGDHGVVVSDEVWDENPYCVGTPFALPHTIAGLSVADLTCDLQDIGTSVQRAALDSLYASVNPRYTAVQGMVNMPELARNRFNDVIRVRQQGAVQPLTIPFMGKEALPMLEFLDQRKEQRTGISKAALGLDADALQSSTAIGVNATLSAAQAKVESIARSYAEGLVAPAYKKIAKLLAENEDRTKMVRARGEFIEIPVHAFQDMDVVPKVGLGRGTQDERLVALTQILAKQEQILQLMGVQNPLVSLPQYSHTLSDLVGLTGVPAERGRYFNPPDVVDQQAAALAEQQTQQPDPEMLKAQAELQIKQQAAQADIQRKQMESQVKLELQERELQAKLTLMVQEMRAKLALQQAELEGEMTLKAEELIAEIELEDQKVKNTPNAPGAGDIPSST